MQQPAISCELANLQVFHVSRSGTDHADSDRAHSRGEGGYCLMSVGFPGRTPTVGFPGRTPTAGSFDTHNVYEYPDELCDK